MPDITIVKKVGSCYHNCYFFGNDGGPGSAMYCNHPTLDHANYGGYIITRENSMNRVPDACPLHDGEAVIKISLKS